VAASENCLVRKSLSQFDSGSHAADNRHRLVLDFSKVDLNSPAMYMLTEQGLGTYVMDTSEPKHNVLLWRAMVERGGITDDSTVSEIKKHLHDARCFQLGDDVFEPTWQPFRVYQSSLSLLTHRSYP
jgi:hypothetical protein